MNLSAIEYCDYTCSFITGCSHSCPYCYARNLAKGRLKKKYLAAGSQLLDGKPEDPFAPRIWMSKLQDKAPKVPSVIFLNNMSDAWGFWIPVSHIHLILEYCQKYPQHTFLHLTKNPRRYLELNHEDIPENCWLGTTITWGQEGRDDELRVMNARGHKTWVSFEPLLDDVIENGTDLDGIKWVVVGAQTAPRLLPKLEWVDHVLREAKARNIPVFLKNNLVPLLGKQFVAKHRTMPFKTAKIST